MKIQTIYIFFIFILFILFIFFLFKNKKRNFLENFYSSSSPYNVNSKLLHPSKLSNSLNPSKPNFGKNMWLSQFNQQNSLFAKRYTPQNLPNSPTYPTRYSLTGDFMDTGPLPSNS